MAERKTYVTAPQAPEDGTNLPCISSVAINRDALTAMVTDGTADKLKPLYRELYGTLHRLGLKAGSAALLSPMDNPPRTLPNMLDIQRWLNSLEPGKEYEDLAFLKSLFNTVEIRLPATFKDEVAKEF